MEFEILVWVESWPISGILDCFVILPRNDKHGVIKSRLEPILETEFRNILKMSHISCD